MRAGTVVEPLPPGPAIGVDMQRWRDRGERYVDRIRDGQLEVEMQMCFIQKERPARCIFHFVPPEMKTRCEPRNC